MKEAFGGIMNIVFLAVFLLVIIGFLGLVVSYTKAFKMKNIVLSTVEEYEGYGCDVASSGTSDDTACMNKIKEEAKKLAFSPASMRCSDGYKEAVGLYCYKIDTEQHIYKIDTTVDVHFPVISNILGMSVFRISGDSRVIPNLVASPY